MTKAFRTTFLAGFILAGLLSVPNVAADCVQTGPTYGVNPNDCPGWDTVYWYAFEYAPWAIECIGWRVANDITSNECPTDPP